MYTVSPIPNAWLQVSLICVSTSKVSLWRTCRGAVNTDVYGSVERYVATQYEELMEKPIGHNIRTVGIRHYGRDTSRDSDCMAMAVLRKRIVVVVTGRGNAHVRLQVYVPELIQNGDPKIQGMS